MDYAAGGLLHRIGDHLLVISPMAMIGAEIETYTGLSLPDFIATYPTGYFYLLLEIPEQGIFMFDSYFIPLFIIIYAFRKKERWVWCVVLISWVINALATIGTNYPTEREVML